MSVMIWHRNDLRLLDNPALAAAFSWGVVEQGEPIIPVYCLDPKIWKSKTRYNFPRQAAFRRKFLLECLQILEARYAEHHVQLITIEGKPDDLIPELAQMLAVKAVFTVKEYAPEELKTQTRLSQRLEAQGCTLNLVEGNTLYHVDDLPFNLRHVPDQFTAYKMQVEHRVLIRKPLQYPLNFRPFSFQQPIPVPFPDVYDNLPSQDPRTAFPLQGGEKQALARLEDYCFTQKHLKRYKETRNGLLGVDYSSKFSPYLAAGCIAPTTIFAEVQRFEREYGANESTYWLVYELMWRDYFRWVVARAGVKAFDAAGILGLPIEWEIDPIKFGAWTRGETGYPIVDACMRELWHTGFMSNRGRQIVASFLTKNLGIDWRMGAAWFESLLIDYDVYSNYGNWNYAAGVGNDPRGFRYFHPTKQAEQYDPQAQFIKTWLPELQKLPTAKIFEPWQLTATEQTKFKVKIGQDYPGPIVDLAQSVQVNTVKYKAAFKKANFKERNSIISKFVK